MKQYLQILLILLIPINVMAQYAEYDWEERDTWMNTSELFDIIGVSKDHKVADIGCHEGYLSIRLANRVGDKGKVFAVDVRMDRLETLKGILKERDLEHVKVVHGDYDDPKLPTNTLDVVIIMDTYHEMTDYMDILKHVKRSLKSGGKIVIIEKLKTRIKGKSRDKQVEAHSLSTKYVKEELEEVGFNVTYENNDLGDWENDEDKVIWMLVAEKQ